MNGGGTWKSRTASEAHREIRLLDKVNKERTDTYVGWYVRCNNRPGARPCRRIFSIVFLFLLALQLPRASASLSLPRFINIDFAISTRERQAYYEPRQQRDHVGDARGTRRCSREKDVYEFRVSHKRIARCLLRNNCENDKYYIFQIHICGYLDRDVVL